jgi:hypothetical protein
MPTPTDTLLSSHGAGLSFTFSGLSSRITKFEVSNSASPKEAGHLGQESGKRQILRKEPLMPGAEIKVEFIGNALPQRRTKGTVNIPACASPTGANLTLNAICTQASAKGQVGKFITGSATFKLSGQSPSTGA